MENNQRIGLAALAGRGFLKKWPVLLAAVAASLFAPMQANAELPSVKLLTAPLVTPANAWTYYGSGTTHTAGSIGWTSTTRPSEIKELARALSQGGTVTGDVYAAAVADYVRKNVETEFRFGLSKGARGALIDQSGTAFDQAHLMVELLRENGAAASYQVGTITLNASQFQSWTGLTNAAASCQFLADGGIPATVNSATSCSGLSGSVSTVTMAHIWISTGGKLYDPAYKQSLLKTGVDLAAALGCGTAGAPTCGSTIASIVPAPVLYTGTSNVYSLTSVPESSIAAQLKTYAVNLQNWILNYNATNKTNLALEDLIGGKIIDRSAVFTPGTTLPYTSSVQYTWSGDIPDQYRTTLRVQFDNIDQTIFVDELSGKRLKIWASSNGFQTTTYTRVSALYAEYKPLAKSSLAGVLSSNANLTLTANHPYAATYGGVAGAYMDEVVQRNTAVGTGTSDGTASMAVMTILNGWGDAAQNTISHFAALSERDLNSLPAEDTGSSNHYWFSKLDPSVGGACYSGGVTVPTTPKPDTGCYEQHQAVSAATWLAQSSRMTSISAQVGGSVAQLHHSLGTIVSDYQGSLNVLNVETSLSINSKTATASDRQGAYYNTTAALSRLEGSTFEQTFDSWDGGSAVSWLTRSNGKGIAALWVDSGNVTTALSKLVNYSLARKNNISAYVTAGYKLIVPQNGYLGTFSYTSGNSLTINQNAFAGYGNSGDRISYIVMDYLKGAGTGSSINPVDSALNTTKVMEYSSKKKKFFGVNPSNGEVTFLPPPDIVAGAGEFPFSLSYQRFYNSSAPNDGLDYSTGNSGTGRSITSWSATMESISDIGGGWSHNFGMAAKYGSDGFKSMGVDSALEASATIAGMYVSHLLNSGTQTFGSHMATILTTNWWEAKLQGNIIYVLRPPAKSVFTRLPDDTSFSPPSSSADRLTQSGARAFKVFLTYGGSGYTYNGTSLSLTTGEGDVIGFTFPTTTIYNVNIGQPTSWTSANGIKTSFSYIAIGSCGSFAPCLSSLSNSLGRSLTYTSTTVKDENNRQITTSGAMYSQVPTQYTVTGLDGGVTKYQYTANPGVAGDRLYPHIYQWFTPSSASTPYLTIDYDRFYRAKGVTDNLTHRTDYFQTGIYGRENWKWGGVKDPLGNLVSNSFDRNGQLIAKVDPLGRASTKVYDNAQRVLREVNPEGDAVEYEYDVRSNVTRECRIAKGRVTWSSLNPVTEQAPQCNAGLGDLVTTTVYMEGPTVWTCVTAKTCNKPSYVIDPKGNRTTYTWSTTHGQLLTETSGLNSGGSCTLSGGVCPVATYGYTSYVGSDGATFYLLTSKQEQIASGNTRTTSWAYNSANKYTLKEQIVDSGGLNLRTCFAFDAAGNLISKTEPKAGLVSCP
jgi:YD repeat-containing protein